MTRYRVQFSLLCFIFLFTLVAIVLGVSLRHIYQQELKRKLIDAANHLDLQDIKSLLDRGADPELTYSEGGANLLYFAAELGDAELVERLLREGLDPNGIPDPSGGGSTALDLAEHHRYTKIAKMLRAAGAYNAPKIPDVAGNAEESYPARSVRKK